MTVIFEHRNVMNEFILTYQTLRVHLTLGDIVDFKPKHMSEQIISQWIER